jgi:hypothetical protein
MIHKFTLKQVAMATSFMYRKNKAIMGNYDISFLIPIKLRIALGINDIIKLLDPAITVTRVFITDIVL